MSPELLFIRLSLGNAHCSHHLGSCIGLFSPFLTSRVGGFSDVYNSKCTMPTVQCCMHRTSSYHRVWCAQALASNSSRSYQRALTLRQYVAYLPRTLCSLYMRPWRIVSSSSQAMNDRKNCPVLMKHNPRVLRDGDKPQHEESGDILLRDTRNFLGDFSLEKNL